MTSNQTELLLFINTVVTSLATVGITSGIKWVNARLSRQQRNQAHQHEMTVRFSISDEYQRLLNHQQERIRVLTSDVSKLYQQNADCSEENARIRAENAAFKKELQVMRSELRTLRSAINSGPPATTTASPT